MGPSTPSPLREAICSPTRITGARGFPLLFSNSGNIILSRQHKVSSNATSLLCATRVKVLESENWWSERLRAWVHEGFNTDAMKKRLTDQPESASDLLLEFESLVARNRTLRKRIINSSMNRNEKSNWLNLLSDVDRTEELERSWETDSAENRPWESYLNKTEAKWVDKGKSSNLNSIIKRLNSLDSSSYSACQPLYILLEDVDSEELIHSMLDDIESDEMRRRELVNDMVKTLQNEGFDASKAKKMGITKALDYLNSIQSDVDNLRKTRLKIDKEIRPFDPILADKLLAKNVEDINDEVDAILENLGARLTSLNLTLEEWKEQGIIFPEGEILARENLLDWESELPEIERLISLQIKALDRWSDFQTFWPDRCESYTLAGKLSATEDFVDFVDSLDQEWRELELQGMQMVNSWEERGFEMSIWRFRLTQEPLNALALLKKAIPMYEVASSLIDSLLALDTSIDGGNEVEKRITILREFDLDAELIDEMKEFVDSKVRRTARHRSMLEKEWMDFVRKGMAEDVPTASLSLVDFEALIRNARTSNGQRGIPVERIRKKLQKEIEDLNDLGFDVGSMNEMLSNNPMELALRMNGIRQSVEKHEHIRQRVSAMDWRRNPELSIPVNHDLSQPDKLDSLVASIPNLLIQLSQNDIVDKDFKFRAWIPNKQPTRVATSEAQNSVEDAMEAILEEMELSTEIDVDLNDDEREMSNEKSEDENIKDENIGIQPAEIESPKNIDVEIDAEDVVEESDEILENNEILTDREEDKNLNDSEDEIQTDNTVTDISGLLVLLRNLGLEESANLLGDNGEIMPVRRSLASIVGVEPRDMRLDRLLRLALRLLPSGNPSDKVRLQLISNLAKFAQELSNWTRIRLEARHVGSKGMLIEDAAQLGAALERIPGPGIALPLDADDYSLPSPDDVEGLSKEVEILGRRVFLSSAGGVR